MPRNTQSVLAELWDARGLYPGLACALDYLGFSAGIEYCIQQKRSGIEEEELRAGLFESLASGHAREEFRGKSYDVARRRWRSLETTQQKLLSETLPRFALNTTQIKKILDEPAAASLWSPLEEIKRDPYIMSEEYIGEGADDAIGFSLVDHGMIPSPEVGEALTEADGPYRLRALIVDQLKHQSQHTFQRAPQGARRSQSLPRQPARVEAGKFYATSPGRGAGGN